MLGIALEGLGVEKYKIYSFDSFLEEIKKVPITKWEQKYHKLFPRKHIWDVAAQKIFDVISEQRLK